MNSSGEINPVPQEGERRFTWSSMALFDDFRFVFHVFCLVFHDVSLVFVETCGVFDDFCLVFVRFHGFTLVVFMVLGLSRSLVPAFHVDHGEELLQVVLIDVHDAQAALELGVVLRALDPRRNPWK